MLWLSQAEEAVEELVAEELADIGLYLTHK
jgi:hypothetical protein